MKTNLMLGLLLVLGVVYSCTAVRGQDSDLPKFRSRSEHLAARRNLEKTFPELVRTLRTLHLPADKMIEAEGKLWRSEAATRAARQELQSLEDENARQGYGNAKSARADELRASLKQSTDQLHSEIKTLLTPQQRDEFERRIEKLNRHSFSKQKSSR